MQAQEVPWTWTAEELTWEAALPFSLVSWLIHSLGFPRCCSTVCTGVLPLAMCSGESQVVREKVQLHSCLVQVTVCSWPSNLCCAISP